MGKGLVHSMLHWWMKKRVREMDIFKNHPIDTQEEVLSQLIYRAKDTEFGKKYGFKDITSHQEFSQRVPLTTYEEFQPLIERARRGEKDVFWPGKIKWFAKSSGTTNDKSKYIPITHESLNDCHYKCGKDMFSIYAHNQPDTKIFECKNLRLGGSSEIYKGHTSIYGDLSAILIDNLPFWAEIKNTPDKKTSLMSDWDSKLQAISDQVLTENIGSFTGVPSWMLVLLRKILQDSGKDYIDEVWPDVEAFFHGGISFKPYEEQYKSLFQKTLRYYEIYNASEGFFGLQDQADSKEMLLLLDYGIYYEFIPFDEFFNENPRVLSLSEVQPHVNYAMVISTNGGLWRYSIGDTVKFTSTYPFRIVVTGRTKHYINAFGEELIIENAEEALRIAEHKTGSIICEYTAGPIYMSINKNGAHEWIIEFEKNPCNPTLFAEILDTELKKLNSDYEAKRYNNMTLSPPKIHYAEKGLFYEWMKKRNKLGGQNKIPRLANTREYLDPLLILNQEIKNER